MTSTGQVYPSLGETVSDGAAHVDNTWSSPTNIYAQDATSNADTAHCAYITAASFDSPDQSYLLKASGFDFSGIPDGATINGVTCRIGAFYTAGQGSGSIDLLQLHDTSRNPTGDNKAASAIALTTTYTTVITQGGAADKWGCALDAAWVKDPDFGVSIGVLATAANADVFVDFVTLEIDYTASSVTNVNAGLAAATATAPQPTVSTVTAGAPTLAGSWPVYTAVGAGSLQTPSFTPQTGDVIVVKAIMANVDVDTFGTPTGGGWVYTSQILDATASHTRCQLWTAPVTSGGTAQTVTVTKESGTNVLYWGFVAELWRGGQVAATPATCDQRGSGAPSTTLTTTQNNSAVSWCCGDWTGTDGSGRAYLSSASEDGYDYQSGQYTGYWAYQSAATQGSQTLGLSSPGGQTWTLIGIEVRGTAAPGTNVNAGLAAATAAATVPANTVTPNAGAAAAAAAAAQPTVSTATATSASAGLAAATAATPAAQPTVTSSAGLATASAAANQPTASTGIQPVGGPSGGPWVLVFADEFDTGTKPDPAVWADHLIEGDAWRCNDNASEVEWYPHDRRGLSVASSALSLTARHESPYTADPACPDPLPSGNTGTYTSGMVQSHPGFQFTYGFIEARISVPAVPGVWPAFWMVAADAVWPPEWDMLESYASGLAEYAWHPEGGGTTYDDYGYPSAGYHVYGMRWSSSDITWFLDGVAQSTTVGSGISSLPASVIFNFAVRNDGTGYPDYTGYPAVMDIDYVRVWVKSGVPGQPEITSVTPSTGVPTSGSLEVAFGAVSGATSYRATACPVDAEADGYTPSRHSATGASSPLTITGLANGVHYSVTVAAVNATGYSIESPPVPALYTPSTTVNAGLAAATAAAPQATVVKQVAAAAGLAAATAASPPPGRQVTANADPAAVAAAAPQPTASTSGATNVNAGLAGASAAGLFSPDGGSISLDLIADSAVTATATAPQATTAVKANAAQSPATAAALQPTVSTSAAAVANAGLAGASAAAPGPRERVASAAAAAPAAAAANPATVQTAAVTSANAGCAAASASGLQASATGASVTQAQAGCATSTAAANPPGTKVTSGAALAAASATVPHAAAQRGKDVAAALATASAGALAAGASAQAAAELAAATASANPADTEARGAIIYGWATSGAGTPAYASAGAGEAAYATAGAGSEPYATGG